MSDGIRVKGKYLFQGEKKFYIRGVTYGTFGPDEWGSPFPSLRTVENDFARMAEAGINAVRVYTPPPLWLLNLAHERGVYVMVGLPWEQHIAFLDQPQLGASIERRIRSEVKELGNHPAILCYVLGNEIPGSIVRWHGARRIERFIRQLYAVVKAEAPEKLVTYVNFPTTEYLHLPFLDFFCFNVYLEEQPKLDAYIARLQNQTGDRPLVLAEVGLDSRRNGEDVQSRTLDWQIRTIFSSGCAGVFVFAWTDEWHRGGHDIEDWDFGLTRRNREPKPALDAVRSAFAEAPFPPGVDWPRISVVVCTHNGAKTLRDCLQGLTNLEYSNYEVIVVDDGSTDRSGAIAEEFGTRLIQIGHSGLAVARNIGMKAAAGEIIAYTDDDARPDPHWLQYLAWTYMHSDCAAAGGPNIAPPDDSPLAECVAHAPGGPVHVLLTDREAEHIPGCNCSFRKDVLAEIGGFDPRFRSAGDDVDVCWKLLERGWKIAFHPGAMVWHHRRSSVRGYLSQQTGYGRAEAMLQRKWPEKYNSASGPEWVGRLYGPGIFRNAGRRRIYHGVWGTAPFQKVYAPAHSEPVLPIHWYLSAFALAGLSLATLHDRRLLFAAFPVALFVIVRLVQLARSIAETTFVHRSLRVRLLTGFLCILQPAARLWGRTAEELAQSNLYAFPYKPAALRRRVLRIWSEQWKPHEVWLQAIESTLVSQGLPVRRGGNFDNWDLESRPGSGGAARLKLAVEEHGSGKQMLLFEVRPRTSPFAACISLLLAILSGLSFWAQNTLFGILAATGATLVLTHIIDDRASAAIPLAASVERLSRQEQTPAEGVVSVVYLGSS
jgi:glycosyltransferase involved in cell wall biosynthesis